MPPGMRGSPIIAVGHVSAGSVAPLPTLRRRRRRACARRAASSPRTRRACSSRPPAPPPTWPRCVERRVAGEPLEHLLGWAEFCGLRIAVGPGVFVPRRRTELLVRLAAPLLRPGDVVVELCCGAAAVATALVAAVPGLALHAVDIDPAAVACARRNLADGQVYEGDLDAPLPAVAAGTGRRRGRQRAVRADRTRSRSCRPRPATTNRGWPSTAARTGSTSSGASPPRARAGSRPGGSLLIETSERQAPSTAAAIAAAGLVPRVERSEELDGTAVVGVRP